MAVDMPQVQRGMTKWTLITTVLLGVVTYLFGVKHLTYGLIFGVILMVLNFKVISVILDYSLRKTSPDFARIISFVSYHVRFWLIVMILYFVIPRTPFLFTVGIFMGFLLPKMIMGIFVVRYADDEWWNRKTQSRPDEIAVARKKAREEGLRFPGLDFDDRYKNDPRFDDDDEDSDWGLK